jgi:3-phosphoshikimate 1-carboxyvinyltransferase
VSELPNEVTFGGIRPLVGELRVPGDKSLSHRAVMLASLARGRSTLSGLATGGDVRATMRAFSSLGVSVKAVGTDATITGSGFDGLREADDVIDCDNSGTTMRLLAGILSGRPFVSVLTGDQSLRKRPMGRVAEPLRSMGATIDGRHDGRLAPLVVRGGVLAAIDFVSEVASAQVKSSILLAGLQSEGTTTVTEPARSRDHTERMLVALGAPLSTDGLRVSVRAGTWDGFEFAVPADPSSAAFFAVGAAITPGSDLVLRDLALNPTRIAFVDVLRRMGAQIEVVEHDTRLGEPVGDLRVRFAELRATTIEGDEIPSLLDEIPALAVAAAFADGVTEIRNAEELIVKESNRIGTIHQELTQLGIGSEPLPDGLIIRGGSPRPTKLKSHGDHRIAMAGAIAANALDGATTIRGWRAIASSYPEFHEHLAALTN